MDQGGLATEWRLSRERRNEIGRRLALFAASLLLLVLLNAAGPMLANASAYSLLVSKTPDRAAPVTLGGRTVSGNVYVYLANPQTGITNVRFWLDNPARTGTPTRTEAGAPYDFAGTSSDATRTAIPYDTKRLLNGTHTISVAVAKSAGGTDILTAAFTVNNALTPPAPDGCSPAPCTFSIQLSSSAGRTSPALLEGKTVSGNAFVFVTPSIGATRVRYFLDNPARTGTPTQTEGGAPWDFRGTNGEGSARPWDSKTVADGQHKITVDITKSTGGTDVMTSTFTVSNTAPPPPPPPPPPPSPNTPQHSSSANRSGASALQGKTVTGDMYVFVATAADITNVDFFIDDPSRTGAPFRSEAGAPFDLAGSNADGTALPYATTRLPNGSHTLTVAVTRAGVVTTTTANFTVSNTASNKCLLVPCADVKIQTPYALDWTEDHDFIKDRNNVGTGFTWLDRPSSGAGFIQNNLDISGGRLNVTTTRGLAALDANNQDNALAVGIDGASRTNQITARIANPPAGSGNFEQAGLWFGVDEKNYVRVVYISTPTGQKVQFYQEVADAQAGSTYSSPLTISGQTIELTLLVKPSDRTLTAKYRVGTGPEATLATWTAPGEFFSFDAAGIDPEIGTRSFAGIVASHRTGPSALNFAFDDFSVTSQAAPPPTGDLSFTRTTFPLLQPTSMAWGPDNRLYVSELFGRIHAVTLGANGQVTGDQVITTLGNRLTLGITVDPQSTPGNVILWAGHSNPSTNAGQANSGIVSRLSGAGFSTRQDVITGLPRAIANHATNGLHFGPDGRLYISQGGNTGAGAHNNANTEFGTMREQPLSAALLVADVRNAGFDGSCNNVTDIFGPAPCDVTPYATGLRNMYDFVWHSNGKIYGPDNGLGVEGSFPPSPTAPCIGAGSTTSWQSGGNNPGPQQDPLNLIQQGRFYGHPNPTRNQCVFKDGHFQGVPAPANWMPPITSLGSNRSSDGIMEYRGDGFCGDLKGDLLLSNYSVGDDLTRVRLSPDGTSVASMTSLVGGFTDPLPVTQSPDGRIFVGDFVFGAGKITVLTPESIGCWKPKQSLPSQILDAGGSAYNGRLYVIGGKNATVHRSTVDVYTPSSNSWSTAPNLPGAAVENPAVTTANGKLYAFGGSTAAFAGAVTNAASFDGTSWTALPAMPVARGGATAQAVGNKIYVMGGMDANGVSLDSVSVYDFTTNSWSAAAPMGTRRDNPGSAAFAGKIYVFGGRTRNADGSSPSGGTTLNTVESYDPATNSWSTKASMPTGRRTMAVGLVNGRAQLMGGEIMPSGGSFPHNEEYDPTTNSWRTLKSMMTPRHGAAAGTIDGIVYVAGGGPTGGFTLSNTNEAFSFGPIP